MIRIIIDNIALKKEREGGTNRERGREREGEEAAGLTVAVHNSCDASCPLQCVYVLCVVPQ